MDTMTFTSFKGKFNLAQFIGVPFFPEKTEYLENRYPYKKWVDIHGFRAQCIPEGFHENQLTLQDNGDRGPIEFTIITNEHNIIVQIEAQTMTAISEKSSWYESPNNNELRLIVYELEECTFNCIDFEDIKQSYHLDSIENLELVSVYFTAVHQYLNAKSLSKSKLKVCFYLIGLQILDYWREPPSYRKKDANFPWTFELDNKKFPESIDAYIKDNWEKFLKWYKKNK